MTKTAKKNEGTVAAAAASPAKKKKQPAKKPKKQPQDPGIQAAAFLFPVLQEGGESFSSYLLSDSISGGKFWSVFQHGHLVLVAYGKITSKPTLKEQTYDTEEEALEQAQKKLQEKLNKGYTVVPNRLAVGEPGWDNADGDKENNSE